MAASTLCAAILPTPWIFFLLRLRGSAVGGWGLCRAGAAGGERRPQRVGQCQVWVQEGCRGRQRQRGEVQVTQGILAIQVQTAGRGAHRFPRTYRTSAPPGSEIPGPGAMASRVASSMFITLVPPRHNGAVPEKCGGCLGRPGTAVPGSPLSP